VHSGGLITVVKFGVKYKGGNSSACFTIEVRADTLKITNVIVAGFGKR